MHLHSLTDTVSYHAKSIWSFWLTTGTGSLAATGKGHHTPQAILLGLEGSDPETIAPATIPGRYASILENKTLYLSGKQRIVFDMDRDMLWRFDRVLKVHNSLIALSTALMLSQTHPNGMRFSVYGAEGELLAVNEYFSVGGGFVVNEKTKSKFLAESHYLQMLTSLQLTKICSTKGSTRKRFIPLAWPRRPP